MSSDWPIGDGEVYSHSLSFKEHLFPHAQLVCPPPLLFRNLLIQPEFDGFHEAGRPSYLLSFS
jgi:hypothetical protein